jgi:hypothetical protein
MAAKTYLVVRASVAEPADRAPFDHWYATEHLPDALAAFGVRRAWRAWSRDDPAVHCAFYEFESLALAQAGTSGPAIAALVAEFDRKWGGRVVRSRELLEVAGELVA